jgi:hypothetical protein
VLVFLIFWTTDRHTKLSEVSQMDKWFKAFSGPVLLLSEYFLINCSGKTSSYS